MARVSKSASLPTLSARRPKPSSTFTIPTCSIGTSFISFSHRRDVKAGNILVDADANIRLADLGVARVLEGTVKKQEARTFVGTPCWMAPEVMNRERYNSRVPLVVSLSSPSGRYLVSRHHGIRALQRLSALSEVRADGDSDPHRPRRVALLRLLQRFLSH